LAFKYLCAHVLATFAKQKEAEYQ